MTEEELIEEIESQRDLMISVSTGGNRIQEVNDEYKEHQSPIPNHCYRCVFSCSIWGSYSRCADRARFMGKVLHMDILF